MAKGEEEGAGCYRPGRRVSGWIKGGYPSPSPKLTSTPPVVLTEDIVRARYGRGESPTLN
jgi:hypothetical protein